MEFNVFRDYCKAENSDDEEIFNDLESRLYAEIYYGSNDAVLDQNSSGNLIKCEIEANNEAEIELEPNLAVSEPKTLSSRALSIDNALANRSKLVQGQAIEVSQLNSNSNCGILKKNDDDGKDKGEFTTKSVKNETRQNANEDDLISEEIIGVKTESDSILKKYEFSKMFINKLYKEKFQNLTETLKLIRNDDEINEMNENGEINEIHENETESKYNVSVKNSRKDEEIILTSDSDSEDSILEVPIPPKPQPPVINLHDSDLDSDEFDSDSKLGSTLGLDSKPISAEHRSETTPTCGKTVLNRNPISTVTISNAASTSTKSALKPAKTSEISPKSTTKQSSNIVKETQTKAVSKSAKKSGEKSKKPVLSIDDAELDLMLNCSEVQKSAASLKEIRNMSKGSLEESLNYERDKNFAEDVVVANFVSPKARKRKLETENENENEKVEDLKRLKGETWQEYFFKPMSESLKAFYNESRGQENFDVEEIQSKMSRDPRLWAILDEDLMPDILKRQRYWNVRCTNCKQPGHQKNTCPEPYKSIRCHICGAQGHIETRCPQKMCLTCGKKQGTFRKTCESCRSLYCNMCNAIGHKSTECPDLWRRFHQTTQVNQINVPDNLSDVMKPADLLYCCNCTKRGHDSSTCSEFRWSQHFPTPSFVSSYTSGPRYSPQSSKIPFEPPQPSKDIIPLIKTQKKCMIFLPSSLDHIESSRLVYAFGSFYTKIPNGEEIERKLAGEQVQLSNMTNLLKGCVSPIFLDELSKMSKFEIKIYYNSSNELVMRVRSTANLTRHIFELFVFWLKLSEEDKRLKIETNLPRTAKPMLKLLITKLEELQKDLQDPRSLSLQIKQVRKSLDSENQQKKLVDSESHQKKSLDDENRQKKSLNSENYQKKSLDWENYQKRSLENENHQQKLLDWESYQKKSLESENYQKKSPYTENYQKKSLENENQQKKSLDFENRQKNSLDVENRQKKLLDLQWKLLKVFHTKPKSNEHLQRLRKAIRCLKHAQKSEIQLENYFCYVVVYNKVFLPRSLTETELQRFLRKYYRSFPEFDGPDASFYTSTGSKKKNKKKQQLSTPYETFLTNLRKPNPNLIEVKIGNGDKKSQKQLRSQDKPLNNPETQKNEKVGNKGFQIGPLSIDNAAEKSQKSTQINIGIKIPEITGRNTDFSAYQASGISVSSEISVQSVKSSKKSRKIENCEGLEEKAEEMIREAVKLNAPYMNRAVDEIKKKVNEKMLKQEHIDTLQRLVSLEKEHRNYVSSFCNYLQ